MPTDLKDNKCFQNAPLVELVAEIRWGMPQVISPQGQQFPGFFMPNPSGSDEFFNRFGNEVNKIGFPRSERLIPPGFPIMQYQPVFRYHKTTENTGSIFYQAGSGLLSVNAIPPYRSWDNFAPVVKNGIDALLKSRDTIEQQQPFNFISLRYIDAFGPIFTRGLDARSFLEDVLNISIILPVCLNTIVADSKKIKPHLQLFLPLTNGMNMQIVIGEGEINNEVSVIMDTTVSTISGEVSPDSQIVMETLNAAHTFIHNMFLRLTAPIQHLMNPVEKNNGDYL